MVYWGYIIVFALAVSAPSLVNGDFYFFSEEILEEILIFFLGALALALFNFERKKVHKNFLEKISLQREVKDFSRDLNDTYSYIGEMNRKIEILRQITSCMPCFGGNDFLDPKNEPGKMIMESISIFSKKSAFIIRIIDVEKKKNIFEWKKNKRDFPIDNEFVSLIRKNPIIEKKDYVIFSSEKGMGNIFSTIIVKKRGNKSPVADPEMMTAVASKILCLFAYSTLTSKKRKFTEITVC